MTALDVLELCNYPSANKDAVLAEIEKMRSFLDNSVYKEAKSIVEGK